MSDKLYITKERGSSFSFPDYKQCFDHEPSQAKTMPEYALVKDFLHRSEQEKQVTMEVLSFLYEFVFATQEQLLSLLTLKGVDASNLDEILFDLIEQRKMNSFYLNQFASAEPAPQDAFVVYCLDFGAIALLKHFSTSDCCAWWTTDCVRSSELVGKYLHTTQFYLALATVHGNNLRYFKPLFDVTFGHRYIRFSAVFEILNGYSSHTFIVETIRNYDLPINWMEKVDEKITPFSCQEQHWSKYFSGVEPVYLLLCEDDNQALEAADLLYRRTEKTNFRMITDEEVAKGMANATFLKYVPNEEHEKVGTLQRVRASLLSGDKT